MTRVGRGRGRGRGRVVPCKSSLVYWSPSITRTAITHIPLINDPLRLRTLVASQQQQVHPSSVTTVYTLHVMYMPRLIGTSTWSGTLALIADITDRGLLPGL